MGVSESVGFAKKVGNFVSNILLGETKEMIIRTDERIKGMVQEVSKISEIDKRVVATETRIKFLQVDSYAPVSSPRKLNEGGLRVLSESGIKDLIDNLKSEVLQVVQSKNITTAYDAEKCILDLLSHLPENHPELLDQLKEGAFRVGVDIQILLLVGGIYLRDLIFPELGFKADDVDSK